MNNDLEQFSEERLKDMQKHVAAGMALGYADALLIRRVIDIALAAKQAKPFCYVSTECIKQNVDVGVGVGGGTWAMSQKPYNGGRGFDLVNPLYTTPQKPVVLLPKFTDRHTCMNAGCDAASAYKEDVIALNKASGSTVKESE